MTRSFKKNNARTPALNPQAKASIMPQTPTLSVYIAASFRQLHAVHLLGTQLQSMGYSIYDWTEKGTPPEGLSAIERRAWMDTDSGGNIFSFCANACQHANIVIYLGESGQDAGVEIGMAHAHGLPILGIRGPLESLGLMLHGAVTTWVENSATALNIMQAIMHDSQDHRKETEQYSNKSQRERIFACLQKHTTLIKQT